MDMTTSPPRRSSASVSSVPTSPAAARRMLLLLTALFVLPFALGSGLYWAGWRPARFANHGELLQPPRALPDDGLRTVDGRPLATAGLRGKWLLLRVARTPCDTTCANDVQQMQRLYIALNKEQSRVQPMWLSAGRGLEPGASTAIPSWSAAHAHFADLVEARLAPDAEGNAWRRIFDDRDRMFYLVDPFGKVMMRYTDPADLRGVLKDLERLLKYSWIR